jgi:hypothetical protein
MLPGQLGDGTNTNFRTTPVQVSGLTSIVAIGGGYFHSVALESDGTVWSWGSNAYGALGEGSFNDQTTPVQVSGLTDVVAIAVGAYHNVSLKSAGAVWVWGNNSYGQLGDGTTASKTTPVQASGITGVVAIAAGSDHSMIFKDIWEVLATGRNDYGQLGDGTITNRNTFTPTVGLNRIDDDSPSDSHDVTETDEMPTTFVLDQNYPNPFNPTTNIRFGLPTTQKVTFRVYNTLGQVVATLYDNESLPAGYHTFNFDAGKLASGTYVYKLEALSADGTKEVLAKKMLLMR